MIRRVPALRVESRTSGKVVHMYKGVGFRFADFIAFSTISHENEIIWSR